MSLADTDSKIDATRLATDLRVAVGKLCRRLRDHARVGDLTWSQVSVLGRLERDGPATVTALAKAEGMRQQSMGANVAALQVAGLVDGRPDPNDGRQTILALSDFARHLIESSRMAREDWLLQTIRQNFTEAEQEILVKAAPLLQRLSDA